MSRLPDDALRALAAVLAPYIAPLIVGASARPFTQKELPPGAGPIKFRRTWHLAHDAHDPGATREGRAMLMTPECWSRWARTERPAPPAPSPAPSLLDELGAKRVSA
jgi:hypothetical protein